jgi:hypothetical protein
MAGVFIKVRRVKIHICWVVKTISFFSFVFYSFIFGIFLYIGDIFSYVVMGADDGNLISFIDPLGLVGDFFWWSLER